MSWSMKRPNAAPNAVVAAAYLRVSTEDQAREGFSIEAQRTRIRAYCAAKGYDLAREFVDDGFSGRTTNRPGFRDLMRVIQEGLIAGAITTRVGAVVVAKFRRPNRSVF